MRSQRRDSTNERDFCEEHPRQAYVEEANADSPHDSHRGNLGSAMTRNKCAGDSDIDDTGKSRRHDDITLTLSALQEALHGRKKRFGHAKQRGNRYYHGRTFVPVAVKHKERRSGERYGDEMKRNGREYKIAERSSD